MAEAGGVAARHEAGARGAAIRRGDVAVGEAEAVFCERIDVWGRDVLGEALTAEFAVTEVVGVEDDDVGLDGGANEERGEQREDTRETDEAAGMHGEERRVGVEGTG